MSIVSSKARCALISNSRLGACRTSSSRKRVAAPSARSSNTSACLCFSFVKPVLGLLSWRQPRKSLTLCQEVTFTWALGSPCVITAAMDCIACRSNATFSRFLGRWRSWAETVGFSNCFHHSGRVNSLSPVRVSVSLSLQCGSEFLTLKANGRRWAVSLDVEVRDEGWALRAGGNARLRRNLTRRHGWCPSGWPSSPHSSYKGSYYICLLVVIARGQLRA